MHRNEVRTATIQAVLQWVGFRMVGTPPIGLIGASGVGLGLGLRVGVRGLGVTWDI